MITRDRHWWSLFLKLLKTSICQETKWKNARHLVLIWAKDCLLVVIGNIFGCFWANILNLFLSKWRLRRCETHTRDCGSERRKFNHGFIQRRVKLGHENLPVRLWMGFKVLLFQFFSETWQLRATKRCSLRIYRVGSKEKIRYYFTVTKRWNVKDEWQGFQNMSGEASLP